MNKTLDLMIEHNSKVDINSFFYRHLGVSYDDYKKLPEQTVLCIKCFETNEKGKSCKKCRSYST